MYIDQQIQESAGHRVLPIALPGSTKDNQGRLSLLNVHGHDGNHETSSQSLPHSIVAEDVDVEQGLYVGHAIDREKQEEVKGSVIEFLMYV